MFIVTFMALELLTDSNLFSDYKPFFCCRLLNDRHPAAAENERQRQIEECSPGPTGRALSSNHSHQYIQC
ncbi:UNVERIFIED_CONTAM: hypothetical protein FKN15_002224 [Acipenser sinensis]